MDPQVSNFEPDFDSDGFFSDPNRAITYDLLQDDAGFSNYTGSALDQVAEIQSQMGGDPNQPRSDDNPGGYLGMQRATDLLSDIGINPMTEMERQPLSNFPQDVQDMVNEKLGGGNVAQGVSSFGDMSSNDMQRLLNRGSISQGSVSEVQQMIDSPQPIAPPEPVAANPIIDVLGTGNVLEPGSSNFAAPSQGDYNFGVQDTFTPPSMMSEYQSAFPQLPSFGQAMPVQQALPQGGLGSLGQTPLPLQQFNVSGSFNAPPIKSPYV